MKILRLNFYICVFVSPGFKKIVVPKEESSLVWVCNIGAPSWDALTTAVDQQMPDSSARSRKRLDAKSSLLSLLSNNSEKLIRGLSLPFNSITFR